MVKIILLILGITILCSCSKNLECTHHEVTSDVIMLDNDCITDLEGDNHIMIISDQESLNSLITSSCVPVVDFNKNDLVLGSQRLFQGIQSIDATYSRSCSDDSEYLDITFRLDNSEVPPNVLFHSIIPKVQNIENIDYSITFI